MKRLSIILLIAALIPTFALANGGGYNRNKGQKQGQVQLQGQLQGQKQKSLNVNKNFAASLAAARSNAKVWVDAESGANTVEVLGGSQDVSVGGDTNVYRPKRQSPGAPSITAFPSGPCTGASIGLSGGWLSGAFGIGGTKLDDECTARADIQMLQALYDRTLNDQYLELINRVILSMDTIKAVTPDYQLGLIDEPGDYVKKRIRLQESMDEYDYLRYHQK